MIFFSIHRAIYLSGGVTMLPGYAERLQAELKKLAPPSVLVEVLITLCLDKGQIFGF